MLGIELTRPCGELVTQAIEQGLLINVTMDNVIRLLPPLIIASPRRGRSSHACAAGAGIPRPAGAAGRRQMMTAG